MIAPVRASPLPVNRARYASDNFDELGENRSAFNPVAISLDYNECRLIDPRYIISPISGIAVGAAISRISPINPSATACRARGGEEITPS